MTAEFNRVNEKLVHQWAVWSLIEGKFVDPSGAEFTRTFVRSPGAVGIIALDGDKGSRKVVLVRQYRPALGVTTLEIPAGMRDLEGEDPILTAHRELEEEAGLVAATMVDLGRHISAPGMSNSFVNLFLATDLTETKIEKIDFERCIEMIKLGEIQDAKTVIGLLLVALTAKTYI